MHESKFTCATTLYYQLLHYSNDKNTLAPKFTFSGDKTRIYSYTPWKSKTFPVEGVGGKGYKIWFLETYVFSLKHSSFVQFIREAQKKKRTGDTERQDNLRYKTRLLKNGLVKQTLVKVKFLVVFFK